MNATKCPGLVPLTPILANELWSVIKAYGASIWVGAGAPDGQALWQPVKKLLGGACGVASWDPAYLTKLGAQGSNVFPMASGLSTFPSRVLGEIGPSRLAFLEAMEASRDTEGTSCKSADAHFFAQLLRLPLRNDCSVLRIFQVFTSVLLCC